MDPVFEPFQTKGLTFQNRIIHEPTTLNLSDPLGHVTRRLVAAYEAFAKGGYGAVVVGATCVRHDGLINERMLGIYDDTYVIGFRDVVEVMHHNNTLAGIQLFYGGLIPGLGTTVPLKPGEGWIPGTVSWGSSNAAAIGNPEPRVLTTADYEDLVECYAQGARRAKEAGFDFVSYHFCHGSLPHTTLSLLSNVGRNDKYADRFLFVEEIIKRTQELCGVDYPLIPRICVDENLEGGFDIDYFVEHYAPRLHALGIAALDCTFGSMLGAKSRREDVQSWEFIGPSFYTAKMINRDNLKTLKQGLAANNIEMPLIGSANLITPDHIREFLSDGAADFAGVCRLSLDDPDFPRKMSEGREDEVRKSTHTGASLLQGNIFGKGWAGSAQNPVFGRDDEYRLRPTNAPKKVVVVGGGSGGMEYAITAREIGHDVIVLEKTDHLGGAMDWAGNYKALPTFGMLRYQPDYHRVMMEKLKVPVRLGARTDAASILAENPDIVVIATGAEAVIPAIPGMEAARSSGFALTMDEIMARKDPREPGQRVIIWGAGEGGELALDLHRQGRNVRVLEPHAAFTPANYMGSRGPVTEAQLGAAGLNIELSTEVIAIGAGEVTLRHGDGRTEVVKADTLVVSLGRTPVNSLARELMGKKVQVQVVGDARTPRSYGNAIHEAAYLARQI